MQDDLSSLSNSIIMRSWLGSKAVQFDQETVMDQECLFQSCRQRRRDVFLSDRRRSEKKRSDIDRYRDLGENSVFEVISRKRRKIGIGGIRRLEIALLARRDGIQPQLQQLEKFESQKFLGARARIDEI